MKSIPFMLTRAIPADIKEGDIIEDEYGNKLKISKIKSVEFLDMRNFRVIGLCKPYDVKPFCVDVDN